ncbi:MAG TPA: DUF2889 domain-containing protein [Sphingobium sp.]|nr:DUF2889 domain-containing protein [Sphingobium sp.]
MAGLDTLPGFRRRLAVFPEPGRVTAAVEDDFHCMAVTLHHDGAIVTAVEAVMDRAPWTTCPGARAMLKTTFEGVALAEAAARGGKKANCTHLYDLAELAAAHAADSAPTRFDILVSDAVEGRNAAEIRRNGQLLLRFQFDHDVIVEPKSARGLSSHKLRPWIASLDPSEREAARLLQWGSLIAHGRAIPMEKQSDATRMRPNCYTFQPENAVNAVRVGRIIDFSTGANQPLSHFGGRSFGPAPR